METAAAAEAMLAILGLTGSAWILGLVMILLLFGANRTLPPARRFGHGFRAFWRAVRDSGHDAGKSLGAGMGKPVADALTHSNQTWEFQDPPALRLRRIRKQVKDQFILWIAQGFGAGRIPLAPGTFGSLVGLIWFVVLLWPGNPW